MVARILLRSSLRFYKQHPLQLLLAIVGIVLGVCIVTAVFITNNSSKRAFALSTEALYGRTSHHIVGAQGIDQQFYAQFRSDFPQLQATPIIEGHVLLGNDVFSLIGIDPFAELPFARLGINNNAGDNGFLSSLLSLDEPSTELPATDFSNANAQSDALLPSAGLLMSAASATRLALTAGDKLQLRTSNRFVETQLLGNLTSDNPAANEGLLIGDIALVQSLLERGDIIDRIDIIADNPLAQQIRDSLPNTLKLNNAASRTQTMLAMTRGFQINLTAMSLLSLLVGAFLIHNTMSFTVLQRRELFAVKRTIGISSPLLFGSILIEAVLISIVGSTIGVFLGLLLGQQLIKLTTQTINDLYFVLHVQEIWFTPWLFFGGLLLGITCSVIAASISALDAARTNPVQAHQRSATEQKTRAVLPALASLGLVIMLFGLALATTPSQSLLLGFIALMLLIVGYGLLLPFISFHASKWLKQVLSGLSPVASMAAGSVERNISRTGLAIAALTVAVSSTFGVDVMIGSFRGSVDNWLGNTLQSDVYLSVPSTVVTQNDGALDDIILQTVQKTEGIRSVSRGLKFKSQSNIGEFDTLALVPHNNQPIGITLISGNTERAWQRFVYEQGVLISEPLATKYQLGPGDNIKLFTELKGDQTFHVVGVVRDYTSSHGQMTLHRDTYNAYWRNRADSTIGIIYQDNINKSEATKKLRSQLTQTNQALHVQANSDIHENSLAIFDRTFEVTRVLRWLTVGVAFVGIFSALLALNLERAREFAVLRATGSSRKQLLSLITAQTLWMGLLAGALAVPLGWMMAKILIHIINLRSFGWSMDSFIPDGTVSSTFVLSCTAALLAGLYPAWRLSQSKIARQLRDE